MLHTRSMHPRRRRSGRLGSLCTSLRHSGRTALLHSLCKELMRLCRRRRCLQHMPCTTWLTQPRTCQLHRPRMQSTKHRPSQRYLQRMLCMTPQPQQKTILHCKQNRLSPDPSRHRPRRLGSPCTSWQCLLSIGLLHSRCKQLMRLCRRRQCLQHMPCTTWLTAPSTCRLRRPHMQSTEHCPSRQSLKHMLCMTPQPQRNTILHCMQHRLSPGPSPSRPRRLGSLCRWWQHLLSTGQRHSWCKQLMRLCRRRRCLLHMLCTTWLTQPSISHFRKPHMESTNRHPDRLARIRKWHMMSSQQRCNCQQDMLSRRTPSLGQSHRHAYLPGRLRMLLLLPEQRTRRCTECRE